MTNHPEGSWEIEFDEKYNPSYEKEDGWTYIPFRGKLKEFIRETLKQHGDKRYEEGKRAGWNSLAAKIGGQSPQIDKAIQALIPNRESNT